MRYRFLLGASAVLAIALVCGQARAQTWYLGGEGGWTNLEDQSGHVNTSPTATPTKEGWNDGYNVGLRAGYEWGPWRFEEEYSFRKNGADKLSLGGVSFPASGDRRAHALMTNVIYDFDIGWPVTPHLGAGIGAVDLVDSITADGASLHGNEWEFGYQAIAGVRYNINPSLAFDLDYRYLATTDPTFHDKASGLSYTSGYSTHSILASLTLRFGQAAPPPPVVAPAAAPAPPPVARRVFLVFFDWDKATITPAGMQIIHQAAEAWRSGTPVQIQVTGYTDTSGSAGYNLRLSQRRANAVANALVRLGVPRTEMAVAGRGEQDLRVPTANGVREPQNRRVEIVFP